MVKLMPSCVVTNERVAWYGTWRYGTFIMVAVAATNVGDIKAEFDHEICTNNSGSQEVSEKIYDEPLVFRFKFSELLSIFSLLNQCRRGDDFGHFNFGSTLVLIYEAPHEINFGPNPVRRIRMGENIVSSRNDGNLAFSSKSI